MEAAECQSKHTRPVWLCGAGTRDDGTWMERVAGESRGKRTDLQITHTHTATHTPEASRIPCTPSADYPIRKVTSPARTASRAPVFTLQMFYHQCCSSLMKTGWTGADVCSASLLTSCPGLFLLLPSARRLRPHDRSEAV